MKNVKQKINSSVHNKFITIFYNNIRITLNCKSIVMRGLNFNGDCYEQINL